jgi:hypothetical protein
VFGLPSKIVPCFLVRNNVFENGDVALRPRLIYVHVLVFTQGLEVDRCATFASRIAALDSERTLTAMLPLDARTGLATPFFIVCSKRVLLSLCL